MFALLFACAGPLHAAPPEAAFPPALESYADASLPGLGTVLRHRITEQPLNLVVTLMFVGAILHTFFAQAFLKYSHRLERRHEAKLALGGNSHFGALAKLFHFLGEVEAVFGIWFIPVFALIAWRFGFGTALYYVDHRVSYAEPVFVVVIMAMASTRPILRLAETILQRVAGWAGGGLVAWWFAILTLGPVLGSFVTEPAAMTIAASLLGQRFFRLQPRPAFAYATLGLLFVNVSVGGTLTHFAAPPVLMVAAPWQWDTPFMLRTFGWVAIIGIVAANLVCFALFRKDFAALQSAPVRPEAGDAGPPIPAWITIGHLLFMAAVVACGHYPPLVIFALLLFLAFQEVSEEHQGTLSLRSPILVGFFLAGLVLHGGLQQWWIAPLLRRLSENQMFFGAIALTAFNDNAAITYLATLVPDLTDAMKQMVVAGAVTGGGLTVIANAPNPAGQAILAKYFGGGIAPAKLFLGALLPTTIVAAVYLLLR